MGNNYMLELFIYLAEVIPLLGKWVTGLAVAYILIGMAIFMISMSGNVDDRKEQEKVVQVFKKYLIDKLKVIIFIFCIGLLFPSERTLYLIIGAHYLKQSSIPSRVEMAINKKLDDYLTIPGNEK